MKRVEFLFKERQRLFLQTQLTGVAGEACFHDWMLNSHRGCLVVALFLSQNLLFKGLRSLQFPTANGYQSTSGRADPTWQDLAKHNRVTAGPDRQEILWTYQTLLKLSGSDLLSKLEIVFFSIFSFFINYISSLGLSS